MANESAGKIALPASRRGFKGFCSETAREMRKVNWPSRKETTRLTGVVLTVCISQAIILLAMQWVFGAVVDAFERGSM